MSWILGARETSLIDKTNFGFRGTIPYIDLQRGILDTKALFWDTNASEIKVWRR